MKTSIAAAEQILAAEFGTTGVTAWIQDNVISLLLILIAAVVLFLAKNGEISKIMTTVFCMIIGLTVLTLAVTPAGAAIGEWVVGLITS